jgi:hypothetical protein
MTKTKLDMTNPAIALEALKTGNDYDPKLIASSIRTVASNGAKLDARIHAAACALLSRSDAHNDCSLVPSLLDAMPKSARRKALIAWFHAFSNVFIRVEKNGTIRANMVGKDAKGYKLVDHASAFAKPFWSVEEKDVDASAFDTLAFAEAVARLIKRATNENAKLDQAGLDALADLKTVAAKLPEKVAKPLGEKKAA